MTRRVSSAYKTLELFLRLRTRPYGAINASRYIEYNNHLLATRSSSDSPFPELSVIIPYCTKVFFHCFYYSLVGVRKVKNASKMADEKDKIRDSDVATNPETQDEDARATSDKKPQHKDLNDTWHATGISGPKY